MMPREHELLAGQSEFCCAVLANPGSDYMLIPTDETLERTEQLVEDGVRRGMRLAGVMGVVRGKARSKCMDPNLSLAMLSAAPDFVALYTARVRARCGDFVQWANALWDLPDDRTPLLTSSTGRCSAFVTLRSQ
jgi:hypothetical protein